MTERTTKQQVDRRLENLNSRMESRGSQIRYAVQSHSGSTHLYRDRIDGARIDHIHAGTRGQIADALWFMMNALDDAARGDNEL